MKKLFTLFMGLGMVASANAQNPFAYGLSTDGNVVSPSAGVLTVNVNYSLNADAESVNALVKNAEGEIVKTLSLTGTTKGSHTAELDLAGIGHGDFTWAIEVKGGATSGNPVEYKTWKFYHPSGLDVDNSFESPSSGTIFVADGYTKGNTSGYESAQADGTDGGGLYMFTADLNNILNKDGGKRFYSDKLTHSYALNTKTPGADFNRVAVADDGRIFVTRHNQSGDYILSAESVESLQAGDGFTSLVEGKNMNASFAYDTEDGNFLVGPNIGLDVKGAGEDTKILMITRNTNSLEFVFSYNRTVEYEIGTSTVLPTPTPITGLDKKYTISYDHSANVKYDNKGGIWYCQYRGSSTDAQPSLVYIDANGKELFKDATGSRRNAAIALNNDCSLLAASSAAKVVTVYQINYGTEEVSLTKLYDITLGGNNNYCAAFDIANNLYIGNATSEYVKGYALSRVSNTVATAAASKYALNIDEATAVGEINTDANAPVEYYNLQGVKVENPANGIFIRKQGSKTTKVVL